MKKKIFVFILLFCMMFSVVPSSFVFAGVIWDTENGVYIDSTYRMVATDSGYEYIFTLILESDSPEKHGVDLGNSILWYGYEGDGDFEGDVRISSTDSGKHTHYTTLINGVEHVTKIFVVMTFQSDKLYFDSSGHNNFVMNLRYYGGSTTPYYKYVYFTLDGDIPNLEPTPEPTVKPTPTPTIKPTPEVTPDVTPEPEPVVTLNVNVNGFDSVSTYYTGGMDSVSSYFEIQWYMYGKDDPDGIYDTMDRVSFVDGRGTYKYTLTRGEWYRAMVSYTYLDSDGVEQTKEVYSDFFQGYEGGNPIVIWNLKSLLEWVWNELMELELTYEGFTISFKQLFLFALIAPTLILFIIYLVGMYGVGFIFHRSGGENVVIKESIDMTERNYELFPDSDGKP